MKRAITNFNRTLICDINIDIVCDKWQTKRLRKGTNRVCAESFISRWRDEFTLVDCKNSNTSLKIKISEEDAKEIIKRLKLSELKSDTFRYASTFSKIKGTTK